MVGDPLLSDSVGSTLDLVVEVVEVDSGLAYLRTMWHGESCCTPASNFHKGETWTLYGNRVSLVDSPPKLLADQESLAFRRPPRDAEAYSSIAEVCAGIGGISMGMHFAGGKSIVQADRNALACNTLQLNGGTVVQGDLNDRACRVAVHKKAADQGCLLTAGIPCQGYSSQGLGLGLSDSRSQTVFPVLQVAWHMQVHGVVLECVASITECEEVMKVFRFFAVHAGFRFTWVKLELASQWAARRHRWWGVFLPGSLPEVCLPGWPDNSQCWPVQAVLPEWPQWTIDEELQLLWTAEEKAAFLNPSYGSDSRVLNKCGKAPTAMHSFGCQLSACPCGCRTRQFSHASLCARGLRGFGVPAAHVQGLRHPHPAELALLNTVPLCFKHLPDLRAALCLVGQLAAPMQVMWVLSHIRTWAAANFSAASPPSPLVLLSQLQRSLLQQARPVPATPAAPLAEPIRVRQKDVVSCLPICEGARVQDLVSITKAKAGPGHVVRVFLHGSRLAEDALLQHSASVIYDLEVSVKRQARHLCIEVSEAAAVSHGPQDDQAPLPTAGVSDVTLWKGLLQLQQAHAPGQFVVLPPLPADFLLRFAEHCERLAEFKELPQRVQLVVPLLHDGHWCLLVLRRDRHTLAPLYLDGIPGRCTDAVRRLARAFAAGIGLPLSSLQVGSWWAQTSSDTCGTCLLAHAHTLFSVSGGQSCHWAAEFVSTNREPGTFYGTGGLSEEQRTKLKTLLGEHGVPSEQLEARVSASIERVGATFIAAALLAKAPWQSLKAAASRPGVSFRWVTPDELQQHILLRTEQKFGATVPQAKSKQSRGKGPKTSQLASLHVDPECLQLTAGSFTSSGGEPLAQLSFAEVGAQATGVCFCSPAQAAPFIADAQSLSVGALGLLITAEVPIESQGSARISSLRFPAVYSPTHEAVLVTGSLLQLGDEDVQIAQGEVTEIESVATAVCRLSIFRDEWKHEWQQIVDAPIRALLQCTPELALCKDPTCPQTQCPAFHAAVDETVDQLIVDLWGRHYCKATGGKVPAMEAELFQVYVRAPTSAVTHLVRLQKSGLYVEPRAADGSGPHSAWAVIWVPNIELSHALHLLRTTEKAVSLARINRRYGLRVKEGDERSVHEKLRPGQEFIKVRILHKFKLHPLPHGYQRASVLKLLRQWSWAAKPMQPDRGDAVGCSWIVGAAEDPPQFALPLQDSFALVTKLSKASGAKPPPPVFASARTKRHILYDDPESDPAVDPWSHGKDPWSLAQAATSHPSKADTPMPAAAKTKWQAMETGLKQEVQSLVHQEIQAKGSEAQASEKRLQKVEAVVSELQQQNQKFEGWFQSFGTKVSDQATALTSLQSTMQQHKQEIQQVKGDVERSVNAAVSKLSNDMTSQMAAQLQGQMEQIQQLFADKKARQA